MTQRDVIVGDCRETMQMMPDGYVDAIVTDPPYGLGFMGVKWDTFAEETGREPVGRPGFDHIGGNHNPSDGVDRQRTQHAEGRRFQRWAEAWGAEALRVAKPGAYLAAFGGARTYHRLTAGLEDAGWEITDSLMWLYGSGFPKHKSKLKPAWEPIVLARKPAKKATLLNIDGCRIDYQGDADRASATPQGACTSTAHAGAEPDAGRGEARIEFARPPLTGRWPANVVLDEDAAAALDAQSSTRKAGASRFFYVAKASRRERDAGLDALPLRDAQKLNASGIGAARAAAGLGLGRNVHPTVKPIALMRWLARLVTPPGGLVLDPFTGSGTTGAAAVLEGFDFLGCEMREEYAAIARARIAHWAAQAA